MNGITVTLFSRWAKELKDFKEPAQGHEINKGQSQTDTSFWLCRGTQPSIMYNDTCRVRLLNKVAYKVCLLSL